MTTAHLAPASIHAAADLVAAGHRLVESLEALPRATLKPQVSERLDREVAELRAGGPLDAALERLGLDITAATIRGSGSRRAELATALRADAETRSVTSDVLRKMQIRLQLIATVFLALTAMTAYVALVYVPRAVNQLAANLPEGDWQLPAALARFEVFRNLWLAFGAGLLLSVLASIVIYAGVLGRERWSDTWNELRLRLPFLKGHAIHGAAARLLEALAHEQAAGIPANETLRRRARGETVPRLRDDLTLAAGRLEAGDPWEVCLRGTFFDTPALADLTSLAGHGAKPSRGYRWAAAQSREQAVGDLQRAIVAGAATVLVPSFLYLFVLLKAAAVTATAVQIEGVRQQIELFTEEVEKMMPKE